MKNVTVEKER